MTEADIGMSRNIVRLTLLLRLLVDDDPPPVPIALGSMILHQLGSASFDCSLSQTALLLFFSISFFTSCICVTASLSQFSQLHRQIPRREEQPLRTSSPPNIIYIPLSLSPLPSKRLQSCWGRIVLKFVGGKCQQHEVAHEGETGKVSRANFRDREGRTVLIMRPRKQNTTSGEGNVRHLVYLLENAILNLPEGQE
ncbi:uncharacterized protein [Spinacia oleracea]|uniref:CRAL-TRIO domain-containing protein n=1 Tax=Spinacia oleracea TaxID=3562 RepID=A0ABM3R859_SPIOL|nr:uncharacterized protein LOC110806048 [Spinacia oleracea]